MVDTEKAPSIERLEEKCRASGLRVTRGMHGILEMIARENRPLSVNDIEADQNVREQCDRSTVYRTLERLTNAGILRPIGLHQRAVHYVLVGQKCEHEYLICETCGRIEPVKVPCSVEGMEQDLVSKTGFRQLYHELMFYGKCPDCA